ncbi:hypothetical protein QSH18_17815, partial [Xanthomonas sp. NCPPB 2654]|uniref:hypothetical protein n=1 Tax=Xanthomonas sp. NCPPB 2654 TaxID=487541 RepID=UPI00256EE362
ARSGSASMTGIRGRGILPLPRTAHILVRRPFGVFPRHGRRFGKGTRYRNSKSNSKNNPESNSNS